MSKPIIVRNNNIEQWRAATNRLSDNVGDPINVYEQDAPVNTSTHYTNTTDTYTHAVDEINAMQLVINDLNTRKVKRTGDTISGSLNIQANLGVNHDATFGLTGVDKLVLNGIPVYATNNLIISKNDSIATNLLYLDTQNAKIGISQVPSGAEKLQVTGATKLTGTLQVTSTSQFDDDIAVGVNKVTIDAPTGNTLIQGTTTGNGLATFTAHGYIDQLYFNGTDISSTTTNGDVSITPNGAGDVQLVADTVRVGDAGVNVYVTSNGAADLILNTNGGTNSGYFSIADGLNGTITISPNGTGDTVVTSDLFVNGATAADIRSITAIGTLFNDVVSTVKIGEAAGTISIGAATGTATIHNANVVMDGDLQVKGGDLTTNQTTFNLLNDTATTVNVFGAGTDINIGAATGDCNIKNATVTVDNDLIVNGGDVYATAGTTVNLFNTTQTTAVNAFGGSTAVSIGAATGTTTVNHSLTVAGGAGQSFVVNDGSVTQFSVDSTNGNVMTLGDVDIRGGDLTTDQTSFNLLNTTATTLNIGGAGTTISIGAATGTTTVNNSLTVAGGADQSFIVNDGSVTQFSVDSTNGNVVTLGDVEIRGGDLTTNQTSFNVLNSPTTVAAFGAGTIISIGAATGTMTLKNANVVMDGDLQVKGGDLTTNQTSFNLLNTTATTLNIGGAATTIAMGNTTNASYVSIAGTKVSTTSTTGALTVAGGLGVAEAVNVGASVTVPILYGQAGTGGAVTIRANRTDLTTGYVEFTDSMDASTSTSGAARFTGGVGIAKKLYVGTDLNVAGAATFSGAVTQNGTGDLSVTTTGTATVSPTGTTTLGTAGQTTSMLGNVSAVTSNQTVTLSPTGTGTVTVYPAVAGAIDRMNIGATTRGTGAFTTLGANSTVSIDTTSNNQSYTTTGAGVITISSGTVGNINNMNIGATTRGTGAFTTLTANDTTTLTKGVDASTTTDGTLVVTGGAGVSGKVFAGSLWSDSVTSIGNGTNGDLTLTGRGTGKVIVADDLTVNVDLVVTGGDITLGNGAANTLSALTAGSTVGIFAGHTGQINIATTNGAPIAINKTGATTTFNGTSSFVGAVNQSSGNISLSGQVVSPIAFADDNANTDFDILSVKATTTGPAIGDILIIPHATWGSAEITVQAYCSTTGAGNNVKLRQLTKLLMTYDGTDVSLTEYGTVLAGSSQLVSYSVTADATNMTLKADPLETGTSLDVGDIITYKMMVTRFSA